MDLTCFTQQLHCTAFLLLLFSCLFSLDYNLKIQWLIFFGVKCSAFYVCKQHLCMSQSSVHLQEELCLAAAYLEQQRDIPLFLLQRHE